MLLRAITLDLGPSHVFPVGLVQFLEDGEVHSAIIHSAGIPPVVVYNTYTEAFHVQEAQ